MSYVSLAYILISNTGLYSYLQISFFEITKSKFSPFLFKRMFHLFLSIIQIICFHYWNICPVRP